MLLTPSNENMPAYVSFKKDDKKVLKCPEGGSRALATLPLHNQLSFKKE